MALNPYIVLWACTTCFSGTNSTEGEAIQAGMLSLLGIVGALLLGFGIFFLYLWRRANMHNKSRSEKVTES